MKAFFKDSDKIVINSMDYTEALVGKAFLNNVTNKQVKIEQRYDVNDDFDGLVISLVDKEDKSDDIIVDPTTKIPRGTITYLSGLSIAPEIYDDLIKVLDDSVVTYYKADPSVGRLEAANRFGIKITAPTDYNYDTYKDCTVEVLTTDSNNTITGKTMKWSDIQDDNTYFEAWPVIKEGYKTIEINIAWTPENVQTITIMLGNIVLASEEV